MRKFPEIQLLMMFRLENRNIPRLLLPRVWLIFGSLLHRFLSWLSLRTGRSKRIMHVKPLSLH
jgi:hypothetical protein